MRLPCWEGVLEDALRSRTERGPLLSGFLDRDGEGLGARRYGVEGGECGDLDVGVGKRRLHGLIVGPWRREAELGGGSSHLRRSRQVVRHDANEFTQSLLVATAKERVEELRGVRPGPAI